jgi:hypothetical protein
MEVYVLQCFQKVSVNTAQVLQPLWRTPSLGLEPLERPYCMSLYQKHEDEVCYLLIRVVALALVVPVTPETIVRNGARNNRYANVKWKGQTPESCQQPGQQPVPWPGHIMDNGGSCVVTYKL